MRTRVQPAARAVPWAWISGLVLGVVLLLFLGGQAVLSRSLYRQLPGPPRPPLQPVVSLGSLSALGCVGCHGEFHAEWQRSAHAQAHTDRLYQEEFAAEGRPYFCTYCHTPLVEQRERVITGIFLFWPRIVAFSRSNQRFDRALQQEGVTCVGCHQRGRALRGPFQLSDAPHEVEADPGFGANSLCQTCHTLDVRFGAHLLRPIQDTFGEWQAYRQAGGDKGCVDCHMPEVAARPLFPGKPPRRSRSHAIRGPLDLDFLRSGLVLRDATLVAGADGGARADVVLWNGTGHRLPTAEPQRRVIVALEALDGAGSVLRATSVTLERVVHGLQEPPGHDTTLLPRETRQMALSLSGSMPAEARSLRLALRYLRWDPTTAVAREAGLTPAQLTLTPYEIVRPWPLR